MLMRALDRYVLKEWLRIFLITSFGFPVMIVIIDLTEKLDTYLQRQIPARDIGISYVYGVPETMFQVLPAAVLFATVFTVSSFTRYSEITAAKASGISFHRFILPLTLGAVFAMCIGFSLNVIIPPLNQKKLNLLQEQKFKDTGERYNFAFATGEGRTYKVGALHASRNMIENVEVERLGTGPALPTTYSIAEQAFYRRDAYWMMVRGHLHIVPNATVDIVFSYDSLLDRSFVERPLELNAATKAPADMGWRELGRYIRALQRSGSDVNPLKVERMLKLRHPGHLRDHSALCGPARHQYAAWWRRMGHRRQSADDCRLSRSRESDARLRRQGHHLARPRSMGPQPDLRGRGCRAAVPGAHMSGGSHAPAPTKVADVAVDIFPVRALRKLGRVGMETLAHTGRFAQFLGDIGRGFKEGRTWAPELVKQMRGIGVDSLPLVVIVASFLGAVSAFQTRYQLFPGVQLSVIGLIVRQSIVLELGPLLTGAGAGRPRRRQDDRRDRHDARHGADRCAGDAGLRSGGVPRGAAAASPR
ncbi:MAG: LptF/LptG family permease [Gemmatimonadaceae bacterium]|nr:LptF/LptG family permease [Gemmatimonadaceae bacterium]